MKKDTNLEKETLNLYRGDFAKLQKFHPELGAGAVIRELVRAHILKVEAKLEAKLATTGATDE